MAMMQSFRNSARLIAIVLGVLMIIFVVQLSGIFDGGPNLFTQTNAGKVNGRTIDGRTYEAIVQQAIEREQRQNPGRLGLEEIERIRNEVWEQIIEAQVLEAEFERRGITVSEDEVVAALRTEPPAEVRSAPDFQTEGQFDMQKYQRWLTSAAAAPVVEALAAQYRDELRRAKLFMTVTNDVLPSDAALWERYRDQNDKVTISLTAIVPRRVIPDSAVTVTPAEAAEYYRAHREEFSRPATAFLSYISIPRLPDASDTAAARARAEALRAEIAGGAPFADVAQRESADTASAARGGDLGEFGKGVMDPAFEQAAFSLPLNTVSEPVLSAFGFHLIEVTRRAGDKATARHILVPVELAGAHRDLVDAQTDSLDRLSGADAPAPDALEQLATSLGTTVGQAAPTQEGSRVLVGNLVVPDAGVWAFTAEPGGLSPVIETPYAMYLFRLDSLAAEGTPELETIRGAVEAAVRDEKKRAKALEMAKAYVARLDAGESPEAAAQAMGLVNQTFGPFPRVSPPLPNGALVGAAFGLTEGEHSGVIDTKDGLYIVKSLKREPAERATFSENLEKDRAALVRLARQDRVRSYLAELRAKAKVVDNRAALREAAQQGALQTS